MGDLYYSTVEEVIKYTGIKYSNLGLPGEKELKAMIEKWLEQVASLVNRNRGRNLLTDLTFGDKIMVDQGVEGWNELTVEGVTVEIETDENEFPQFREMIAINRIEIASTVGANTIIASKLIEEDYRDLSNAKTLTITVKPYVDCDKGDIQLLLSGDIKCGNIKKTMDFPEMTENEWKACRFYLGRNADLNEIKSIGLKLIDTVGGYFWIADIQKLILPEGIHNIAMRVCANMVKLAYANRESPVIRLEEMDAKLIEDKIMTTPIKNELRTYYKKPEFGFHVVGG